MTTAGKRATGEVTLVLAGWAIAQPLMTIIGQPISGPVTYSILGGILIGGAAYIATRGRANK